MSLDFEELEEFVAWLRTLHPLFPSRVKNHTRCYTCGQRLVYSDDQDPDRVIAAHRRKRCPLIPHKHGPRKPRVVQSGPIALKRAA